MNKEKIYKMNSRERVERALNFKEPDRIPIDLGATIVTGIHIDPYAKLRRRIEGVKGLPKVCDLFQMLADVEEPVRQRFHVDIIGLPMLPAIGIPLKDWKPWRFRDEKILVPGKFNPAINGSGDMLLSQGGDLSKPPIWKLPKGGFYFDSIERSNIMKFLDDWELNRPKPETVVSSFLHKFTDEELKVIDQQSEFLFKNTEYAIIAPFWEGDVWGPGGLLGWPIIMQKDKEYAKEFLELKTRRILENLALYTQALGDRCSVIIVQAWDYGTQHSELYSPQLFREMQLPYYQKINNWIHAHTRMKTFFHCDGSIFNLIPMFIEAGVDILNPVQFSADNMDPQKLKEKFGKKIVFWGGGVDTQHTLPFKSAKEVKTEVKNLINIFAPDGGYIFASVHNIQAGTPVENIITMYDTAFNDGWY